MRGAPGWLPSETSRIESGSARRLPGPGAAQSAAAKRTPEITSTAKIGTNFRIERRRVRQGRLAFPRKIGRSPENILREILELRTRIAGPCWAPRVERENVRHRSEIGFEGGEYSIGLPGSFRSLFQLVAQAVGSWAMFASTALPSAARNHIFSHDATTSRAGFVALRCRPAGQRLEGIRSCRSLGHHRSNCGTPQGTFRRKGPWRRFGATAPRRPPKLIFDGRFNARLTALACSPAPKPH